MKITLSINGAHSIEVDYFEIVDFIACLGDTSVRADFFSELAKHPASRMRAEAASKKCLPLAMLERLVMDPSIDVVRSVAGNRTALQSFDTDTFMAMMERDVSIAFELAARHDAMKTSVREDMVAELRKHEDQYIRDIL